MRVVWWIVLLTGCRQIFGLEDPVVGGVADAPLGDAIHHDGSVNGGDGAATDALQLPYYVQGNVASANPGDTTLSASFLDMQSIGRSNLVAVTWTGSNGVEGISDLAGNTYQRVGPAITNAARGQVTYFGPTTTSGINAVTVMFTGPIESASVRIAEYRGLSSIDHSNIASSSGASVSSQITTTNAHDVVVALDAAGGSLLSPDTYYTLRLNVGATALQDREVTTAGTYSVDATQDASTDYILQMIAFAVQP